MNQKTESDQIKECFFNGLLSARANGTMIMNEACHRDFYKLGINSGAAQHELIAYFHQESAEFSKTGLLPSYMQTKAFLDLMAFRYAGSSIFVKDQNYTIMTPEGIPNEKNERHESHQVTGPNPTPKHERVQHADDARVTRRQSDKNSKHGSLRSGRRKTTGDQLREQPVPREEIITQAS